jgi:hypothetical protein
VAREPECAVTDAPPTRYRVVERGRRLVVIDTLTGQPATRELAVHESKAVAPATRPVEASAPSAVDDRSGHAVLTTSRFYDLKAPRRIVMTPAFNERFGKAARGWLIAIVVIGTVATLFFPMLWLLVAVALIQPKLRGGLRSWITARLDEADQAAS